MRFGMALPTPKNGTFFATPAELREWFEANHETAPDLWVGYHTKRTGRTVKPWGSSFNPNHDGMTS